jgi:MinD superfamily P-loop ATPase
MKIAIGSGKGGTGKTTVAAALVSIWREPLIAVDLDVEAPNLHLFLNPAIDDCVTAGMEIPVVDETKCTYCRKCSEICQFKAISVLGEVVLTFPEMCHGCGGCIAVCPEGALTPGSRDLGEICWGRAAHAGFLMGRLRIGEAMSPPLMRSVKAKLGEMLADSPHDVIIDAPPGVSCPAVNAVMDTDAILLVTEPTPFGLYDLKLAHAAFAPMGKPMGVVINRHGLGSDDVETYCLENHLPVMAKIPYDRRIAEVYSDGQIISDAIPDLKAVFQNLAESLRSMVKLEETDRDSNLNNRNTEILKTFGSDQWRHT